jgi:hypothetical protein
MRPELVITAAGRFVRVQADLAAFLREYLLRNGIPCATPEWREESLHQEIRLGQTVNTGLVQALLDRWAPPGTR